jgi:nucleoside-diphosphate-sugar epimerase
VKIVHPDRIVDSMLGAAASAAEVERTGVVVVGLDRNGRRLVRAAAARGWRVLAMDDFGDRREVELLEPLPGVLVVRRSDCFAAEARAFREAPWMTRLVGTGEAEFRRIRKLAQTASAADVLWSEHRARLGEVNLGRMQHALDAPLARAG